MQVGLIGFGKVARVFHAPLISAEPRLRLSHVVERHDNQSQRLYPDVRVVRSHTELLETEVDLVVVLTPNESHFPLAAEALSAGKHVVLDKPMTLTSSEADQLIELADEKNRILSVFHNRRWDADFLTLKDLLERGAVGSTVHLESRFDRFRPHLKGGWREEERPGSGVLYDLGSHLFDQVFQLFGPCGSLLADLRVEREGARTTDAFEILLRYEDHSVTLHGSCLAAEEKVRFRLRGDRGAWVKYGLDPQEQALGEGVTPGGAGWGEEAAGQWGSLYDSEGGSRKEPSIPGDYGAFYRGLAQALETGNPPPVRAEEARDVIKAIELCLQSHREQRWVEWAPPS